MTNYMNAHYLTLLLSDENIMGLFFGGAYSLLGLLYVLIVALLVRLYAGSKNPFRLKMALCVLAVASSFLTFTLGAGVGDLSMGVILFIWVGFPLLVIILALAKSSKPASRL
jgi:hypothetical protein